MASVSRCLIFFSFAGVLFAQGSSLSVAPLVITQCVSGRGAATLSWKSPGPGLVQVRVGDAQGPAMTGREAPAGSAQTGDWVSDGMVFVLVNDAGTEVARVTATVSCGAIPDPLDAALATGAWFPLQVGNQWVYRLDNRVITSAYTTWTITRTEQRGDQTYYVLSTAPGVGQPSDMLLRSDGDGRIYRIRDIALQTEELWLDPTVNPDPSAVLKIRQRNFTYTGALGTFSGGIIYDTDQVSLIRESGTFVRGLGLVERSAVLQTGSSGGFTDGLQLVSVRIGKGIRLATTALTFQFGAESTRLDVTNKKVTNCAIPCYFTACGIAGADPSNTYKPCFQARMNVQHPLDGSGITAEIELRDPSDRQVFQVTVPLTKSDVLADFTAFQQVPLYAKPNEPFAPGDYRLNGRLKRNGADAGSATVPVRID